MLIPSFKKAVDGVYQIANGKEDDLRVEPFLVLGQAVGGLLHRSNPKEIDASTVYIERRIRELPRHPQRADAALALESTLATTKSWLNEDQRMAGRVVPLTQIERTTIGMLRDKPKAPVDLLKSVHAQVNAEPYALADAIPSLASRGLISVTSGRNPTCKLTPLGRYTAEISAAVIEPGRSRLLP